MYSVTLGENYFTNSSALEDKVIFKTQLLLWRPRALISTDISHTCKYITRCIVNVTHGLHCRIEWGENNVTQSRFRDGGLIWNVKCGIKTIFLWLTC